VNAGIVGPREAALVLFARDFDVEEIGAGELQRSEGPTDCDLVCFNFDYPDMSGLKLIPETKRRWPSVPVLMLTMQNSSDLALWALRTRVFDLLVKPITEQEIERCLQRVHPALQARRTQSERKSQPPAAPLPAETRYRPQVRAAPRLQAAIAHISKHYARHIAESEVALLCQMSPSRFCREFKAAFGVTFLEYLGAHRLKEAKRLLGNPGMSVSDVANAVGFSDPSYFTRVFRRQEGVAPSEYRLTAGASATELDNLGSLHTQIG
jgi:YesN/AraC family two-component response regulator